MWLVKHPSRANVDADAPQVYTKHDPPLRGRHRKDVVGSKAVELYINIRRLQQLDGPRQGRQEADTREYEDPGQAYGLCRPCAIERGTLNMVGKKGGKRAC